MSLDQEINLVIALATCAAAIASWVAARSARRASKAAEEQTMLQRPRPVVIVAGSWSLENSLDDPDGFMIKNIGSSPAFDIEISNVEGPLLKQVQHRESLTTDHTFFLETGAKRIAVHHRLMPGNVIDHDAVAKFVQNAGQAFPLIGAMGAPTLEHLLKFRVEYSTLDGRQIRTECLLRFDLGANRLRADIIPVSSWLGTETPSKVRP
jgi:hypothetical protein